MGKIILTIKDDSKLSFFLKLMKQLDFVEVDKASFKRKSTTKKYDFFASAGLWKNRDINPDELKRELSKIKKDLAHLKVLDVDRQVCEQFIE